MAESTTTAAGTVVVVVVGAVVVVDVLVVVDVPLVVVVPSVVVVEVGAVVAGAVVVEVVVVLGLVVVVGGMVVTVVPVGGGSAGRTMTGVVVVTGTEVVVVLIVVDELGDAGPPDPAADLGLVVVVDMVLVPAGSATVKKIGCENEELLLRATRAKVARSLAPGAIALGPRSRRTRTRAENVPVAQLFGWCEYTTTRAGAERSLSWQVLAWRTVPMTSTWPPAAPSLLGWRCADMTKAGAAGAAAVLAAVLAAALVATRPKVAHMTAASTAPTAFMNTYRPR